MHSGLMNYDVGDYHMKMCFSYGPSADMPAASFALHACGVATHAGGGCFWVFDSDMALKSDCTQ